jgi:hypothetical protein
MGAQRLADLRVRADHHDGHRGPVPNMPACRREYVNGERLFTLARGRQVADHTAGSVGKSKFDRPVQVLDAMTELAANPKDRYLPDGACTDLLAPRGGRTDS